MKKLILVFLLFMVGCATNEDKEVAKKTSWGIGKEKTEQGQPVDCVKANEQYKEYSAVFVGNSDQKKIYLTFDNGYENGYTPIILDILKEKKAPSIFFVTSHYAANEVDLMKRIINEGHIVGNHSFTHNSFASMTKEQVKKDILKMHSLMIDKYNYVMDVVRPPAGEFSIDSLNASKELNYQCVFWSFAYYDYDVNNQMSNEKALEKMKSGLHPGAIYLLHAVSKTNAEILDEFIDYAYSEGYVISKYDLYS